MKHSKETERGPGRPPFEPTLEQRQRVAIAAGGGMSHEHIAIGLGISRPTLEKWFSHELSAGAYGKRLEVLNAMHDAAIKGSVAAQKAYIGLTSKNAAVEISGAEAAKLGKKEQATEDAKVAHQADPDWAVLLVSPDRPQ